MPPSPESVVLRELTRAWNLFNMYHLGSALSHCVIELSDTTARLGRWSSQDRTISLSRSLALERPWSQVVEVLRHEMVHQFVDEVLGIRDETAHGPAFRETCRRLGLDPSAHGLPEGGDVPEARILRRIRGLLALAGSSNEHEAQSAMNLAHRLMLQYNIDEAQARGTTGYGVRVLGEVKGRFPAHEKILAGILARHFFVEVIWVSAWDPRTGRRGRSLEVSGTPQNLEIATWVHSFLLATGERLWKDWRGQKGLKGNQDRQQFLSGVMMGFYHKLQGQAEECAREGLVWQGDADLKDWVAWRHPHLRTNRGPTIYTSSAYRGGQEAGKRIVLHKPVQARSGGGGLLEG